jgi:hypothetical protein
MTNKPDIAYRLTTSTSITKDELLEAANEIVDLRAAFSDALLKYSVLLAKYENETNALIAERNDLRLEVCELSSNGSIDDAIRISVERGWSDVTTTRYWCDSCADPIECGNEFFYAELPCDIASANAGESATVCRKCNERIEADCNNGKFRTTDMS